MDRRRKAQTWYSPPQPVNRAPPPSCCLCLLASRTVEATEVIRAIEAVEATEVIEARSVWCSSGAA
jgi:hypothetical protein